MPTDPTSPPPDAATVRNNEARWRAIVQSAIDGIVVIDARGLIEAFNPGAERLFGYTEAELLGKNVSVLMPSPDREQHDGYMSRYLATGEPHIIGIGREVHARHRDGTIVPVHLSVGQFILDGVPKFVGILHDLRARVQLEERLREQAAMARLGEMAAVVAHEIRNPLAGIRGAVQVIGGRLPAESRDAQVAHEIVARIDSLNELVKDLLVFARPPQPRLAPAGLRALVDSTIEFLKRDPLLTNVTLEVTGDDLRVSADAELFKIVLVNVIVNAAQAMAGAGRVDVGIDREGEWVRLTLHDSGPGMPADVRA